MNFQSIFLFVFGKHIFTYWSETWSSSEDWLADIEKDLMNKKTRVRRGSDFDPWDLQVRSGLFSSGRGILAVEDHGGGKQFLRFKCQTYYSFAGYLLSATLCALAVIAAVNMQMWVAAIFWAMFSIAVYRYLIETAACLDSLYHAFQTLNESEQIEPPPVAKSAHLNGAYRDKKKFSRKVSAIQDKVLVEEGEDEFNHKTG
jgi:hypothetical protein